MGVILVRVKVYYADTDAGGVVYYANYLRWMEMGRCELIEGMGMTVQQLASQGVLFAVAHVEIDYIVSAVLGDVVEIETEVRRVRRVRFMLQQRAVRVADGKLLATASLTLASVDSTGKLIALPQPVRDALCQKLEACG